MNPAHIHTVKRVISTYAPSLFSAIRYGRGTLHKWQQARLQASLVPWKAKFIERYDFEIQAGPFAGMKFHRSSAAQAYLPILIGSYEAEIHGFIEAALARRPTTIVDVGSSVGYVAVGLARRAPQATVHAFDIDASCRADTKTLAQMNAVEARVVIDSECTPEKLDGLCAARTLVFSDCEGYELELLDPVNAPRLANADIIIELHDFMRVDVAITPTILARFRDIHEIAIANVSHPAEADYPCLADFPREIRVKALHEDRIQYQQWAYLKAKSW
jgi:Methyltransferase small domain